MLIGIDIGWSEGRPSCGLAADLDIWPEQWARSSYANAQGRPCVWAAVATLSQLISFLHQARDHGHIRGPATVVIDGPLGPRKPPCTGTSRLVDSACMRGQFQNRAVPSAVCGASEYVAATYLAAFALTGRLGGSAYRTVPVHRGHDTIEIFETNPTVGMAVLLPPVQNTGVLPTRDDARQHPSGEVCASKSDWYWIDGAGELVGNALGVHHLACTCHERRAAIYCLAVAKQIHDRNPALSWAGDPATGIYALLGPIHEQWLPHIEATRPHAAPLPHGEADAVAPAQQVDGHQAVTCNDPNCLLHDRPLGVKQCPYCPWTKDDQTTWAGIDGHFHQCEGRPAELTYQEFKAQICNQHWPR